jgi:peroxiredoxin Q/BCP
MRVRNLLTAICFVVPAAATAQGADSAVGRPAAVLVSGPREGERAPDFSLPWASRDTAGADPWFSLSARRGRIVVLAFYPRDFTAGCTAEMKTFSARYEELFGSGVEVVGINADSLSTHQRFANSLGLPFRLLSDPDQGVSRAYGSADKGGYNRRTVYVIDRHGQVAYMDLRFNALDPRSYDDLRDGIAEARRQ